MILYHGSNVRIVQVNLEMSNVGKDFGCGFNISSVQKGLLNISPYYDPRELYDRRNDQGHGQAAP